MIYFDKLTRTALSENFRRWQEPDKSLFVGHSESLLHSSHQYQYVQPAAYRR
jgi:chemotaxis methyl-accepting protein methylase